jgi:Holliday junction DNA helicase RuvB
MKRKNDVDDQPTDLRSCQPTSLRHIIGQPKVVETLGIAIEACFAEGKRFPDTLLTGPAGCGKTATCHVLQHECATTLHYAIGSQLNDMAAMTAFLLNAKDGELLGVDEVHELDKHIQTLLFIVLDKRILPVKGNSTVQGIPLANFSMLLMTTDEYKVLAPLKDRMRLVLRFTLYSEDELAQVVRQRVNALKWEIEDGLLEAIAARSKGTPRLALRILESMRRCLVAEGATKLTHAHFERVCTLEGIHPLGVSNEELRLMQLLAEQGKARQNVIASNLALPARTVAEFEGFLIRAGLILKDEQGRRQLTKRGHEYLIQNSPEAS